MTRAPRAPAGPFRAVAEVDVLVLPSATTMRFTVLIAAMLTTGLFLGTTVFAAVASSPFVGAAVACLGSTTSPAALCLSGELAYVVYAVGGALVIAVGAIVVVLVAPSVIARRRRLRRPAANLAGAAARIAALAADVGVRPPPELLRRASRSSPRSRPVASRAGWPHRPVSGWTGSAVSTIHRWCSSRPLR